MCTRVVRWFVVCLAAFLAGTGCQALEVKLRVDETAQVARTAGTVTSGVPFAKGAVKEVRKLTVSIGGRPTPAQFIAIAPWDDGSVRWALMDVQVDAPASGTVGLVVSDGGGNPAPAQPVKIEDAADAVRVSTGPLEFVVSKKKPGLFESLSVDGKELVTSAGRGLVLYTETGEEVVAGAPTKVKVEQAGPMRAIVCVKGKYPGLHHGLLGYAVRISAYAGQKFLKVHLWLENHGAMGYRVGDEGGSSTTMEWFLFDGMAVELGLGLGHSVNAKCEEVEAVDNFKVLQTCRLSRAQENERYKKPPFYTWDDFDYCITSGDKELKKGDRTEGIVELSGTSGMLTTVIRGFWENYEKAIELDGKILRLWLWPTEGQWPRARPIRYDGLFDKDLETAPRDGLYYLPGAVHKGHEFVLDFSGRNSQETAAELSAPLVALASAEYYASTEAAPGLFAPPEVRTGNRECDFKLNAWMRMTRSAADPESPTGLFKARQSSSASIVTYFLDSSYWFGWMDFGDLSVPGRGPVSLHYDWLWIMLINAMRTGDVNFMRLASDMARHRIDVDQYWSDRDPPEVRGLQRGDLNFPAFHCYRLYRPPDVRTNWLAGVVLYYMLTGEPKALECSQRNIEGLKAAWEWIARTRPWAGPQGDMAANAWAISSYCAMYDLTADRKWLEEALELFRTNVTAMWQEKGPHLHQAGKQIRSQDYIEEDVKYCYAIQPFCELHHRTGDKELMQLLQEGCEKEFPPSSFFEAPSFLSGLYAYVGLKTGQRDYIKKAAELFAEAFPESKSPPVYLPDTSVWSRHSGMMLRTGHLLQYAYWKQRSTK